MNKIKSALFIIIVLLGFSPNATFAKQPPAMATGGNALNIIFLVDISGSMIDKYTVVQDALKKLITNPSLAAQANFSLLTWGSSTCVWGSPVNCGTYTYQVPQYQTSQVCSNQPIYQYKKVCNANGKCSYQRVLVGYTNVCTTKTTLVGYTTQTKQRYQWVPLSSNKQQNYIDMMNAIALIDNSGGGTNVDPPMNFVQSYLNSSDFSQQFNVCGNTIVIVLSDGLWNATSAYTVAANLLAKTPSIKTFAVAFGEDPTASTFTAMAQAGGTDAGLGGFTINADVLANTFLAAIQSVMLDTYTAVAPTILPKTTAGDLILAPEFEYSPTTQWKGYLKATRLNSDGSVGSLLWELGQNLAAVNPDNRNIWTAIPGLAAPQKTDTATPNNLLYGSTQYVDPIAAAMETTGILSASSAAGDAISLIKFIRGYDVFDEDSNASTLFRWKLNDIYNAKPTYVGQPVQSLSSDPSFIGGLRYFYNKNPASYEAFKSKQRIPMVYAGSNAGLIHAIGADDGAEKWAFLPPQLMNKMKSVMTSVLNTTNSIYGVDGALVAQDVYVDNEWRTYLAVTDGLGARGFSVLDVTNPLLPLHVFSIENYIDANGVKTVKKWASDGTLSTISGYETLGHTTSAPIFTYTKDNGTYEPVLVLGAGVSNSGITSGVGSSVFVISLKPATAGNIVATKDVSSIQNPSTSVVTINTTATTSNTNVLSLSNTYAIDIGSGVSGNGIAANTVVSSVDNGAQVTLSQNTAGIVSSGTPITFTRRIFNEVEAQVEILESGSTPYMKGKYGYRMLVPNNNGFINSFDDAATNAASIDNSGSAFSIINSATTFSNDRLINQALSVSSDTADPADELNIIYGTGDMDMLSLIGKSPKNLIVSIQDLEKNIFGVNYSRNFSQFLDATSTNSNSCVSAAQQGWYVDINAISAWDAQNNAILCTNGKLSSKIEAYGGIASIPVYIPPQPSSANYCSSGDSAVIFRSTKCGYEASRGIYLKDMTIGGVAAYKGNLYISVSSKNGAGTIDSTGNFKKTDNIIVGQPNFKLIGTNRLSTKSKIRIH